MKWCNKSKKDRCENWYTVPPPVYTCLNEVHQWCNNYESTGRFYYHYTNTRWWFEFEEDAILFALKFN